MRLFRWLDTNAVALSAVLAAASTGAMVGVAVLARLSGV